MLYLVWGCYLVLYHSEDADLKTISRVIGVTYKIQGDFIWTISHLLYKVKSKFRAWSLQLGSK